MITVIFTVKTGASVHNRFLIGGSAYYPPEKALVFCKQLCHVIWQKGQKYRYWPILCMTLTAKSSSSTPWTIPGYSTSSYRPTHHFPIQSVSAEEELDSVGGSTSGILTRADTEVKVNAESWKRSHDFGFAQKQLSTLTLNLCLSSE